MILAYSLLAKLGLSLRFWQRYTAIFNWRNLLKRLTVFKSSSKALLMNIPRSSLVVFAPFFLTSCSSLTHCSNHNADSDYCGTFAQGIDCNSVRQSCDKTFYYEQLNKEGATICSCDTELMNSEIEARD
jgi:hypothetical protein